MFEKSNQFLKDSTFPSFIYHFANQMIRLEGRSNPELLLASGLLSNEIFKGNVCIDFVKYSGKSSKHDFPENETELSFPNAKEWYEALNASKIVGQPGEAKPLIMEKQEGDCLLYLNRYWQYEDRLVQIIKEQLALGHHHSTAPGSDDIINKLFSTTAGTDETTKSAALTALNSPLTVITGGPGTGKTTIVLKILALILDEHQQINPTKPYRFKLVAPTGKAASRLKESIIDRKRELVHQKLISEGLSDLIVEDASTIHRLLGYIPGSVFFKHNLNHPLPIDCLIVDEASMVDLALMSKLLEAVPQKAKIILLGDENQLASVEAGSVLRDICLGLRNNELYRHCVVTLTKSHRFSSEKGIGQLSQLINEGKGKDAVALLDQYQSDHDSEIETREGAIAWETVPKPTGLFSKIKQHYFDHYKQLIRAESIEQAFQVFNNFMMLTALRRGPYGVEQINQLIESILISQDLLVKGKEWYSGKPVLIISNDYRLKLFNGDIGITFLDPETNDLRVYFKMDDGFRRISPYRLSNYETAYAITVHKSQGSEFNQVLLLLPPGETPILTKELIYTGITRARNRVIIMGEKQVFIKGINKSIERVSGLRHKLAKKKTDVRKSSDIESLSPEWLDVFEDSIEPVKPLVQLLAANKLPIPETEYESDTLDEAMVSELAWPGHHPPIAILNDHQKEFQQQWIDNGWEIFFVSESPSEELLEIILHKLGA